MKILVLGGGIGGMAAAIRLAQQGDQVTLVELAGDWKALGTGLTLSVLTLRALCDLGLGPEIAAQGFVHDGVDIYDNHGGFVRSVLSRRTIAEDFPSEGAILRPVLHRIMSEKVRAEGVEVRLGDTVAEIETGDSGSRITFASGATEEYDLVIGADGVYSKLRGLVLPEVARPAYTGQACWRILFDRPEEITRGRMFQSETMKVGFNPCSPTQMYMYLMEAVPADRMRRAEADLPGIARALLQDDFGEVLGDYIGQIGAETPIIYRPLESVMVERPWHVGSVLLIGDAVHATTPHLGSGAGLAVEDAVVLAQELAATGYDLPATFERFMERRLSRAKYVVDTSRRIGEMEIGGAPMMERSLLLAEGFARVAEPYAA